MVPEPERVECALIACRAAQGGGTSDGWWHCPCWWPPAPQPQSPLPLPPCTPGERWRRPARRAPVCNQCSEQPVRCRGRGIIPGAQCRGHAAQEGRTGIVPPNPNPTGMTSAVARFMHARESDCSAGACLGGAAAANAPTSQLPPVTNICKLCPLLRARTGIHKDQCVL